MKISPPRLNDLNSPLNSPPPSLTHSPLHSQTSSESHLCWICFDDENQEILLANTCGCKSRNVHASCLTKWISRSKQKECKVCTEEWPDIFISSSEILSTIESPHDIKCFSISLLFSYGFVYGIVYATFAIGDYAVQIFIAILGNSLIIAIWNKICASPTRRTIRKKACEDISLLIGVYSCFLVGWICGYMIVLPDLKNFLMCGLIGHSFNFASWLFVSFLRYFCVSTELSFDETQ